MRGSQYVWIDEGVATFVVSCDRCGMAWGPWTNRETAHDFAYRHGKRHNMWLRDDKREAS